MSHDDTVIPIDLDLTPTRPLPRPTLNERVAKRLDQLSALTTKAIEGVRYTGGSECDAVLDLISVRDGIREVAAVVRASDIGGES